MKVIPKQIKYHVIKYTNSAECFMEIGRLLQEENYRFTEGDIRIYNSRKLEIIFANGQAMEVLPNNYILVNLDDSKDIIITNDLDDYIEIKEN